MRDDQQSFHDLLQRIRDGSQEAVVELVEDYGPLVLRVVRRRLHPKLRPKFDSLDFVQSVWASFFADTSRLGNFSTKEALVEYLMRMAHNKTVDEFRKRLQTAKYTVNREVALDDGTVAERADPSVPRVPTPSHRAIAHETWDRLLRGQPPIYREILKLRWQGATFDEIAATLQISERTARRVINRLLPGGQ
jgi:RNA polymerase sigma-70 factor (ECF subfamily)